MAEARSGADWARTAHVLALLANVHRDPKKTPPFTPDDWNPHAQKRAAGAAPAERVKLRDVKDLLLGLKPARK
jgi:hypothetical protein